MGDMKQESIIFNNAFNTALFGVRGFYYAY